MFADIKKSSNFALQFDGKTWSVRLAGPGR